MTCLRVCHFFCFINSTAEPLLQIFQLCYGSVWYFHLIYHFPGLVEFSCCSLEACWTSYDGYFSLFAKWCTNLHFFRLSFWRFILSLL
jgi:hypothetical protein